MTDALVFDANTPSLIDIVEEESERAYREHLEWEDMCQKMKTGDFSDVNNLTESVKLSHFKVDSGDKLGVYIIQHRPKNVVEAIAYVGEGIVANRVPKYYRPFHDMILKKCFSDNKSNPYKVGKAMFNMDSNADHWYVQYLPFYGEFAKNICKKFENFMYITYAENGLEPMFCNESQSGIVS